MRFAWIILAGLAAAPVAADEGPSLLERGAELFFRGLQEEIGPALEDLQALADEFGPAMGSFIQEMGPALGEIIDEVRDWTVYHPPEILPNGDIILRRRTDRAPKAEPEAAPKAAPPAEQIDI